MWRDGRTSALSQWGQLIVVSGRGRLGRRRGRQRADGAVRPVARGAGEVLLDAVDGRELVGREGHRHRHAPQVVVDDRVVLDVELGRRHRGCR